MKTTSIRRVLLVGAVSALVSASVAHAQLLTGRVFGSFQDMGEANTTVTNTPDGSFALFETGIPETPADFQSSVEFNQQFFANAGPGILVSDLFLVTNGVTLLDTAAETAVFDLSIELTSPDALTSSLTTITFSIDNTPNDPDNTNPDLFNIAWTSLPTVYIGDQMATFEFIVDEGFAVAEGESRSVGALAVTFTPVPEPSSFALFGVGMLGGAAMLRRRRRSSGSSTAAV